MEISDTKTTNMEEPVDLSGDVNVVSEQNEPSTGESGVGPSYKVTLSNTQPSVSSSSTLTKLAFITYDITYQYDISRSVSEWLAWLKERKNRCSSRRRAL